jgi:hypothetical protein
MENLDFDWPDGDFALNYGALEFLIPDRPTVSPAAERASPFVEPIKPVAEPADQPSGESISHFSD